MIKGYDSKRDYDADVYLYAKGHYERKNAIDDLKRIYSLRNGIDEEHLRIINIINCLYHLAEKHIMTNSRTVGDFIFDLHPSNFWKYNKFEEDEYTFEKAIISKCLSVLSMTLVEDIPVKLGEASSTVLPLCKS